MEHLAEALARIPGVVAVALGGSRAQGTNRDDSDWDFGLYYRDRIDTDAVRALGYEGYVSEPGEWGRLVNGGAWLTVDGQRVDLLYRDLAAVEHWTQQALAGLFEVSMEGGYVAGMPTYAYAGELAVGKLLAGELPPVGGFPDALREAAPERWRRAADFCLRYARPQAERADVTAVAGLVARAIMSVAHARFAERGEWALNEKGLVRRAGLASAEDPLLLLSSKPDALVRAVDGARVLLGL